MTTKRKDNVVSIKQWKARASLYQGAMKQGWSVTAKDLIDVNRPATFYICEPLHTGFTAFSVFDRSGFENLVKSGVKKFGSAKEIFEAVAAVTMDLIENPTSANQELMEAVFTGNLINFSGSQTASQIAQDKSYCHFGAIVYKNPLRTDGVAVSFRPMAMSDQNATLDKETLVLTVARYMLHDEANHPEYFKGITLIDSLVAFAEKLGVDLPSLLESEDQNIS